MKLYDLVIIGAGPAGVSTAKAATDKGLSVLILERGKDLLKRRDPLSGWFGKGITDIERFEPTDVLLNNQKAIDDALKIVKKVLPSNIKSIDKNKSYIFQQKVGSDLASFFFEKLQKKSDILFNSEVLKVEQNEQGFLVHTAKNVFNCRNCVVSTGRYSIGWVKNFCEDFKINTAVGTFRIGVRVEVPTFRVKDFLENGNITISDGYSGTEDARFDSFVSEWEESNLLSAYGRSILGKESHKTNFMVGTSVNMSLDEMTREIGIINVLANDRIKCERVFDYLEGKSVVKHIRVFDNLRIIFEKIDTVIPSFSTYATMYVPEVRLCGILPVSSNMETPVIKLYGAGECTNRVSNLIGAIASGIIAAKTIAKE